MLARSLLAEGQHAQVDSMLRTLHDVIRSSEWCLGSKMRAGVGQSIRTR
jgi:hypothetical protein